MLSFLATVTSGSAEVSDMLSLANLAIPPSLGKIESRFTGQSDRWVIHIQDVHAHLTAQENIAALIEHLHTYYGINVVAIEGGWAASSFPKSWALPPSRPKQMLARALLEDSFITGSIHAALFSATPITIAGIEDKTLYEQNRQIYLQHLQQREAVLEKVKTLGSKIQQAKTAAFNPGLLAFDQALTEFREGTKADKFIPSLLTQAESKGVDLGNFNQISIFKKAMELEKSIDKQKLQGEAGRLMEEFKRKGLHFEELLKSGEIAPEKLEFYPNAQKYLELMHMQDEINHRQFFEEIEAAITQMKKKLIVSEEEKSLDHRSSAFLLAKKIILFQATPGDLKAFEEAKQEAEQDLQEAGLSEALPLGLQFYELAKQRDQIFFERIANHPKLQGNIAVVTGGFHTEGMSARFEEAGISYTVITPDLGNEPGDEKLYFTRLTEDLASAQTLSDLRNKYAKPFDSAFVRGVQWLTGHSNNLKEAASIVRTYRAGSPKSGEEAPLPPSTPQQTFSGLTGDQQKETVQKWLKEIKENTKPVWLFIKGETLKKILNPDSARSEVRLASESLWSQILANPANKIVLLYEDMSQILDIEGLEKRNVLRIPNKDFDEAIRDSRFDKARKENAIAITDPEYKGKAAGIIFSKPTLASLLLFRPAVESLQGGAMIDFNDPENQSFIEQILGGLQKEGLLETAA